MISHRKRQNAAMTAKKCCCRGKIARSSTSNKLLSCGLVWLAVIWAGTWAFARDDINANSVGEISRARDVADVLRERCVRCHGPTKAKGNLRLDISASQSASSPSGAAISGTSVPSKILKRIESNDPELRMPKGEPPLPEADMQLLRNWISDGAPSLGLAIGSTPYPRPLSAHQSNPTTLLQDAWEARDSLKILYIPAILYLIAWVVVERLRKRAPPRDGVTGSISQTLQGLSQLHRFHFVYLAALMIMVGLILVTRSKSSRVQFEYDEFRREAPFYSIAETASNDPARPTIHRPKHPPRLGGEYYRGNDERHPDLFNGGYYRTAVMKLALVDASGVELHWKDTIDDKGLAVRLTIQRAPHATAVLFDESALVRCYLTDRIPEPDHQFQEGEQAFFETRIPGEQWEATFPLLRELGSKNRREEGRVYLWAGDAIPHYGIAYSLSIEAGQITESSELWMGAMYLTPGVFIPKPERIPIAEWFDFLPIPEITSENSHNPELLGIESQPDP